MFPRPIAGTASAGPLNAGDGAPLTLGDPTVLGELFTPNAVHSLAVIGRTLVDGAGSVYAWRPTGETLHDGTPIVDDGLQLGEMSRSHQREPDAENDRGLCGTLKAAGRFRKDQPQEQHVILGPRGYQVSAPVVLPAAAFTATVGAPSLTQADGRPLTILPGPLAEDDPQLAGWRAGGGEWCAFDWDGDGVADLLIAEMPTADDYSLDPVSGVAPEDPRERYYRDGTFKGTSDGRPGERPNADWHLSLFRNTTASESDGLTFTFVGRATLAGSTAADADHGGEEEEEELLGLPGGPMDSVDGSDPSAGLAVLGYYGDLWHVPFTPAPTVEAGTGSGQGQFGHAVELLTPHGAPFTRDANLHGQGSVAAGTLMQQPAAAQQQQQREGTAAAAGHDDLWVGDVGSNVAWLCWLGTDAGGRPIYDTPRKVKQYNPMVNGGFFSVPTVGDLSHSGHDDLLIGGIEGYLLHYRCLATTPHLQFAPPIRLRNGDAEIRRFGKPNPSGGYHWGGSQGPLDGFMGGYSNPVLVDWDGDGQLDVLVSDMIGLIDWYPHRNRPSSSSTSSSGAAAASGSTLRADASRPLLEHPIRLHVVDDTLGNGCGTAGDDNNHYDVFGPWRVQPAAGDLTGTGLPDLITMDMELDLVFYPRLTNHHQHDGQRDLSALGPPLKCRYEDDGSTIKSSGAHTPGGGEGRGRTKLQLVDWDATGKAGKAAGRLDLLMGTGPQGGSTFHSSFVLLLRNRGFNASGEPVFARPEVLLYGEDGEALEFWRHCAHPTAVRWQGQGRGLVVGSDMGTLEYYREEYFGADRAAASADQRVFRTDAQMSRL